MVKYQVFLSSVSNELKNERNNVISGLIESNTYFPVAMEYFLASDSTIKLIYGYLMDADVYVLIIKNDFGSRIREKNAKLLEEMCKKDEKLKIEIEAFCCDTGKKTEDITYTQLEYIFAKALEIKMLAFVYKENEDTKLSDRIKEFCGSSFDNTAKGWSNESQLREEILNSLNRLLSAEENDSLGWVRRKTDPLFLKFKKYGITDVLDEEEENTRFKNKMKNAVELDMFYTTGFLFVRSNQELLTSFVARGGTIKLLCGYPYSDFLSDVHEVEELHHERNNKMSIHNEFGEVINTLQQIYGKAKKDCGDKNPLGRIIVGSGKTLFRSSIRVVKLDNNDIFGWVKFTLPPAKSKDMFCFEVEKKKADDSAGLLKSVMEHFDSVWKLAEMKNELLEINDTTEYSAPEKAKDEEGLKDREYWEEKYKDALRNQRKKKGNRVLIEVAAQHPLKDNAYPDDEFKARLDFAIARIKEEKEHGNEVEIYVPGSIHLDFEGIEDDCSLSFAGMEYLKEKGLSADIIHGEDLNSKYDEARIWKGVYNSADECYIASKYFYEENFDKLICVCSPNQVIRKTFLYINQGILPLVYSVPIDHLFHKPIGEIYDALPYLLGKDHDCQGEDSFEAKRTRLERMPGFKDN